MSKIYIVSLVFTMVTPPKKGIVNGSHAQQPDISIQNEVGICRAETADEAYAKIAGPARLKYPGHHITIRVVIETSEIDLNMAG